MAINRTQALVLGFFVLAWASLAALFAAAPEVYGRALGLSSAAARLLFLVAITVFLSLLSMGVIRRWRWVFWLIFVAFLFGPLRVLASVLALERVMNLGKSRIEMRISRSAWFPRDLCFLHS